MNFYFATKEFGITAEGIHFLRRRFVYKTVPYSALEKIEFKMGMQLNNWFIIFLLGVAMFGLGVYFSVSIINTFETYGIPTRAFKIFYLALIPVVGAYFIYESLQYGLILKIKYNKVEQRKFHIKRLTSEERRKFCSLMDQKFGNKFVTDFSLTRNHG